MSERSAPAAPTASRIQPTVTSSTPLTETLTAQIRIAPAATSKRLTPIPMCLRLLSVDRGIGRNLRVCRGNASGRYSDTVVQKLEGRQHHRPLERVERTLQLLDCRDVEMVRRLVEDEAVDAARGEERDQRPRPLAG